jgi:hypothetical protein
LHLHDPKIEKETADMQAILEEPSESSQKKHAVRSTSRLFPKLKEQKRVRMHDP